MYPIILSVSNGSENLSLFKWPQPICFVLCRRGLVTGMRRRLRVMDNRRRFLDPENDNKSRSYWTFPSFLRRVRNYTRVDPLVDWENRKFFSTVKCSIPGLLVLVFIGIVRLNAKIRSEETQVKESKVTTFSHEHSTIGRSVFWPDPLVKYNRDKQN